MARSCYNYSFFYKRSTNRIMSKPPTAQRRRGRRSVSPDGQASPQQPKAEKIAKTHLRFTHSGVRAPRSLLFLPKKHKKKKRITQKMNVPTQTASENPSARQSSSSHVPTCRTSPRLHHPWSGGVKTGNKRGFARKKSQARYCQIQITR